VLSLRSLSLKPRVDLVGKKTNRTAAGTKPNWFWKIFSLAKAPEGCPADGNFVADILNLYDAHETPRMILNTRLCCD
jgi:hypothetical protein